MSAFDDLSKSQSEGLPPACGRKRPVHLDREPKRSPVSWTGHAGCRLSSTQQLGTRRTCSNDSSHLFAVPETATAIFARPWPWQQPVRRRATMADYDDPRVSALGLTQGDHVWPSPTSRSFDVGAIMSCAPDRPWWSCAIPGSAIGPARRMRCTSTCGHSGRNLLATAEPSATMPTEPNGSGHVGAQHRHL